MRVTLQNLWPNLLCLALFLSCTSAPVTLRPEGCRTQAPYANNTNFVAKTKKIKSSYWSIFGDKNLVLSELLAEQDIRCEEVGTISYKVSQDALDVVLSLLPGISRGSVELVVTDAAVVDYFEPISIAQTPILMPRKDMRASAPKASPAIFKPKQKGQLGVFYESLQGAFSQTDLSSDAGADLEQGAPVGLGLSGSYLFSDTTSLDGRISFSKVTEANFGEFGEASLPFEMNLNALVKYRGPGSIFRFGGGLDHERFSLFNNTELTLGAEEVEAFSTAVTFAYAQVERYFELFELPARLSLGGGMSVASSSSYTYLEGTSLTGLKLQFQFIFSPAPSWHTYFSYKQLQLSGETEVAIERIGLGLSYDFF